MEKFYLDEYLENKFAAAAEESETFYPETSCHGNLTVEEDSLEAAYRTERRDCPEASGKAERGMQAGTGGVSAGGVPAEFTALCRRVKEAFFLQWEREANLRSSMEIQKKAIIGYKNEVAYFKDKIRTLIREYDAAATLFPIWYENLVDAVYHENWGMAGIAEWFGEQYRQSSSAKIIGERIYFMENGRMTLKFQRIEEERREQLIRAFLLLTPEERLDRDVHEIYLLDGTRVTIFGGGTAKTGQDTIIFRRYIVPNYSFEEQAARGTIPAAAIPLFRAMVAVGFSVAFLGAVRTAKSTFLCTWQTYEDESLEGVMLETDPEIPLHSLMPKAPIVQLLADNENLTKISKHLLRSDADYFILAEARDGVALDTALRIACKGTKRMKLTFHTRNPRDFPAEAAAEIVKATGGSLELTARKVAENFDYLFHFVQLRDKSQKRLSGIYELCYSRDKGEPETTPICVYDYDADGWRFFDHIGEGKAQYGEEESAADFKEMKRVLAELAGKEMVYRDENQAG